MENKLKVLKKISKLFNENNITWNVGASCMLYLRGIVAIFDDVDIMVNLDDVSKVKMLLSTYPLDEKYPNEQYKTKVFLEYVIEGVEIDVMAGFIIVNDGEDYAFPLERSKEMDQVYLDGNIIYLESVETWLTYYRLMNRTDKVEIIESYLKNRKE